MPFFFIGPAWILCVVAGVLLLCFRGLRRAGLYVICVSTGATLVSFVLSTAILYLGPRIGMERLGQSAGIVLIGSYLLGIGVGALLGACAGFLVARKLAANR